MFELEICRDVDPPIIEMVNEPTRGLESDNETTVICVETPEQLVEWLKENWEMESSKFDIEMGSGPQILICSGWDPKYDEAVGRLARLMKNDGFILSVD